MITVFKRTENGLEVLDQPANNSWINVIDPTPEEIEHLTALGIPQNFITYPLDADERPRTEREDDGTLLILIRAPLFQGFQADVPYSSIPMGIIMTNRMIL